MSPVLTKRLVGTVAAMTCACGEVHESAETEAFRSPTTTAPVDSGSEDVELPARTDAGMGSAAAAPTTDSGRPPPIGCGAIMCGTLSWGQAYYGMSCPEATSVCVDSRWEFWPICFADVTPCRSASLGRACVVDDQGHLGVISLGGSIVVANPGWTFSGRNYGPAKATLLPADQERCTKALEAAGQGLVQCGDAGSAQDEYNRRYPDAGLPARESAPIGPRCPAL